MKVRCQLQAVKFSHDGSSPAAHHETVSKERTRAYDISGQLSAHQEASSVEMMNLQEEREAGGGNEEQLSSVGSVSKLS